IAELHVHILETSVRLRHGVDGDHADEVADDRDLVGHISAADRGKVDRHRWTRPAESASASAGAAHSASPEAAAAKSAAALRRAPSAAPLTSGSALRAGFGA